MNIVLIIISSIGIASIIFGLIIRPLWAIGDIPNELEKLRHELKEIKDILKEKSDGNIGNGT